MGTPPRTMTLEIDPGSDPISGLLDDGSGAQPFSGWLGLAAALQAALGLESESSNETRGSGRPRLDRY